MAVANLDTNKVKVGMQDQTLVYNTETALDGSAGGEFTVTSPSDKFLLIIRNADSSNDETVTIKAPAKPLMGAGTGFPDRAVTVTKAKTTFVKVEALRYMEADTHKIKITGSSDVKVTVVEL